MALCVFSFGRDHLQRPLYRQHRRPLSPPVCEDGSVDYAKPSQVYRLGTSKRERTASAWSAPRVNPTVNVQEHCEIIRVAVEQSRRARARDGWLRCQLHRRSH